LQAWGANGGNNNAINTGGRGGYSTGLINLTAGEILHIYVGGRGSTTGVGIAPGGFNGGGNGGNFGASNPTGGGGGASDIRVSTDSLFARVIVAGRRRRFWIKSRINYNDGFGRSWTEEFKEEME